ncbi:MAG: TolC family protein [Bacteroidales bacterium]
MNTINKLILMILFGALTWNLSAQENTLNEYLVEAGENNPGLKAAYQEYYAALEKIPQVGALPDPKLSFGYFISPVETRLGPQQFKVSISQMFPWFGTLKGKEKVSAEKAKVKYQKFNSLKNEIYKDVKKKWYELYKVQEAIRITRKNLEVLNSLKQITDRNYETGETQMTDILRLKVNIREQENELEDRQEKLATLKTEFNLLLNKDETASIDPPEEIVQDSFDLVAYRDSIRNNPDLTALKHKENSLEHEYEVAKKQGYPNISLALEYAVIGERTDMQANNSGRDIFMPMIGISIPIYRKKYDAMQKEKQLELEAVQSLQQEQVNSLSSQYKNAEEQYVDALRKVNLYKEQTEETERIYNLLKTSYSADGQDFYELLRTRLMALKFELKYEKAKANQNIAVVKMKYLTNQNQ